MKIMFDASVMQYPATGVAKTLFCLYNSSLSLMPSLKVSALHRQPLMYSLPSNIQSVQLGTYIPGRYWRGLGIPISILYHQPDIIHFPWNGNVPRLFSNTIVVTTIHDVLPLIIPNYFHSELDEKAYRDRIQNDIDRTHLLITDSEFSKQEIMKNFIVKAEPLVLYHGPTIQLDRQFINLKQKKVDDYFLYVGGYDQRKGIESLLKVFISLHKKKLLSSKLILTGTKHYFSTGFKQLIDEGHSLKILEEMGYVSDTVLSGLLSNAKALVYPSKYEGFGLPPLEAMALGCPVITTRYTSIPEICGDAAYYIEPDNEENFAEGLIALEDDSELRSRLTIKGKKQATKFSWDISAKKFLEEITKTLLSR